MFRTMRGLAVGALLILVHLSVAGDAAAAPKSHLGVPTKDLVNLVYTLSAGNPPSGPTRILPNGEAVENFEIPRRKLLVITDIEWWVNKFGEFEGRRSVQVELKIKDAGNTTREIHLAWVPVDDIGFGSKSLHLTSGIVLDSSVALSVPLAGNQGPIFQPLIIDGGATLVLRGYLIKKGNADYN